MGAAEALWEGIFDRVRGDQGRGEDPCSGVADVPDNGVPHGPPDDFSWGLPVWGEEE